MIHIVILSVFVIGSVSLVCLQVIGYCQVAKHLHQYDQEHQSIKTTLISTLNVCLHCPQKVFDRENVVDITHCVVPERETTVYCSKARPDR
jgi:hypothetical protein